MTIHKIKSTVIFFIASWAMLTSATASAQVVTTEQLLDEVRLSGADSLVQLNLLEDRPPDFHKLMTGLGTNFADCFVDADGLWCIDKNTKNVENWSDPSDDTSQSTLLNCGNPALGLDTKKPETCTTFGRDSEQANYITGKRNGKSNVALKVTVDAEPLIVDFGCPANFVEFTDNTNYLCVADLTTGRPLINDWDLIEGALSNELFGGEKVALVLEQRRNVLIYWNLHPETGIATQADEIGDGKSWGLKGQDFLLNTTFYEYVRPTFAGAERPGESDFFILATTTNGEIRALDMADPSAAFVKFDFTDHRGAPDTCPGDEDYFDVTYSPHTSLLYATDLNSCLAHVLAPVANANGDFLELAVVQEGDPLEPLTLSTEDASEGTFPPRLAHTTPGVNVNLKGCIISCTPIPGMQIFGVNLAGTATASNMTLLQVIGNPDCRWIPIFCADQLYDGPSPPPYTTSEEALEWLIDDAPVTVIVELDPTLDPEPANLMLNMVTFMPDDVKELVDLPDVVLMERTIRAQAQNDYVYSMFVAIPQPGVVTEEVFEIEVDVTDFAGTPLGCELNLPNQSPLYTEPDGMGGESVGTLNWDIFAKASDANTTYISGTSGGRRPYATAYPNYETRVINHKCVNPPRGSISTWSLLPYDLEITPCTVMPDGVGDWITAGICPLDDADPYSSVDRDPAVLVKLLLHQDRDLRDALTELACTSIDDNTSPPPLDPLTTCITLTAMIDDWQFQFLKGLTAMLDPKGSQGNENLGAYASKLQQFVDAIEFEIDNPDPARPDLRNRKGELLSRALSQQHNLEERALKSTLADGFGGDAGWIF